MSRRPAKRQRGYTECSRFRRPLYVTQDISDSMKISDPNDLNKYMEFIDKKINTLSENIEKNNQQISTLINICVEEKNLQETIFQQQQRIVELECYIKNAENTSKYNNYIN